MLAKKRTFLCVALIGIMSTSIAIATTDPNKNDESEQPKKSKNVKITSSYFDYTTFLLQPLKEELGAIKKNLGKAI